MLETLCKTYMFQAIVGNMFQLYMGNMQLSFKPSQFRICPAGQRAGNNFENVFHAILGTVFRTHLLDSRRSQVWSCPMDFQISTNSS